MPHVVQLRAVVQTVGDSGVATPDERVEEASYCVPVRRAGEGRVLPRHAEPLDAYPRLTREDIQAAIRYADGS